MPVTRKNLNLLLFCVALSPSLLRAQTPTVDQVLQHYVAALGGATQIEKIHTMVLRGTLDLPDFKASGSTVEYFKSPDHFAAITQIVGHGTTQEVYDGHEGWQSDPKHGVTQITGDDLADVARRADIHWNLKLKEFYPNLQVKDEEPVEGDDAWKLEASPGKAVYDFFFSVKTGLLSGLILTSTFPMERRVSASATTVESAKCCLPSARRKRQYP